MTPASVIAIAIGSAFFFAVTEVAMRNALRAATPVMTSFAVMVVQFVLVSVWVLGTVGFSGLDLSGFLWFAVAGFFNPYLFLLFYLIGVKRIGVARSASIKGSAPIFAVIFASAYLGERLQPLQYLGIALIVGGVLVISTEEIGKTRPEKANPDITPASSKGTGFLSGLEGSWRKADAVFPLLAGVVAGVASVFFKASMAKLPSALLGVWISTVVGMVLFPLSVFLFPADQRFSLSRPSIPWIVLAGTSAMLGMYGFVHALGSGQASIVLTLAQTSPLLVVLISVLFLRQLERVTPRVVGGAILTVGGGGLVSLF